MHANTFTHAHICRNTWTNIIRIYIHTHIHYTYIIHTYANTTYSPIPRISSVCKGQRVQITTLTRNINCTLPLPHISSQVSNTPLRVLFLHLNEIKGEIKGALCYWITFQFGKQKHRISVNKSPACFNNNWFLFLSFEGVFAFHVVWSTVSIAVFKGDACKGLMLWKQVCHLGLILAMYSRLFPSYPPPPPPSLLPVP